MTTEAQVKEYQFQGNPVVQVKLGNLVYDERGEEILAIHNERFRGVSNIEDKTSYKPGQPLSYSNVPRILSYAQLLRERFPDMHVLSPEEVVQYWNAIPERDQTYADTNSIAVYPNQGSNEDLRKAVLAILGKQDTELPLIVSGLGVERADDNYGFTFTKTDYTKAEEAPYLQKDGKLSYDGTNLVQSEEGVPVLVPGDQSGLRGLYRGRSYRLYARGDFLLNSGGDGRVQVLYDPQGRAENLEARLEDLQEEKARQIAEIDARYKTASEYLRTGKFQ